MLISYLCIFFYICLSLMIFHEEGKILIRRGSIKKYFKEQNNAGYFMLICNPLSLVLLMSFYYNIDSRENKENFFVILSKYTNKILKHKPFKD